jgi:FkbM family methyltransferase
VAAEHGEAVFIVPTISDAAKLFISNERRSEFVSLARACAVLRNAGRLTEPATIVDVGAHLGTTTITALISHGFARAVALEPDPDNLRLLRTNIALNGLVERATVVPAAVSSNAGQRWFAPRRQRERWASGVLIDEPVADAVAVDVMTLDDVAARDIVDPATVGLLWLGRVLDEGTLTSGSLFLRQRIPIVFVYPRGRIAASSPFLRQLEEYGYERSLDLRQPNLDQELSEWTPTIEPIRAIATLLPRKSITDVLVF